MHTIERQIYRFEEFELDAQNRVLRRADEEKPVPLPAKAFDLLLVLVENNNRLVGKDEIFNRVWGDQIVEESNLTVHVSQIRKALGETRNKPRFITTVPGYGYRFAAEVTNTVAAADNSFLIETETLSRIVVEKEQIVEDISDDHSGAVNSISKTQNNVANNVVGERKRADWHFRQALALCAAVAAIGAALAIGYHLFLSAQRSVPFEKIKFSRLTNSGKISGAAISPDGKYVAYIISESDGNSLWQQQIGTASAIQLLPPVKAEFWGLTYAPDGSFLYYNLFGGDNSDIELFRVPSLGGVVERIPNVITGSISFAPDSQRIAFVQTDSASNANYLFTANPDGSDQRLTAKKEQPNTFSLELSAEWSPDGAMLACVVNQFDADASYSSLIGVNPHDGSEKLLSNQRWFDVRSMKWLRDNSALLISASDKIGGRKQIWLVPVGTGAAPRQITNDLNSYGWLNVAADGKSFVAVQDNTVNSIAVGEIGNEKSEFKEIASETGTLHPLIWTPDNRLVFRSDKDGAANLWTMNSDGSQRRQLTVNAAVDWRGMCAPADGKYLVFGSWRGGKSNLWRVDADGKNLTQLTDGEADLYPACAPDGRAVIYQRGFYRPTLWKVPIEGGAPMPLTDFRAKWAAISHDGKQVSYFHIADNKWRIGFVASDGGAMLRRVDVPANLVEKTVAWTPDNAALFYINTVGNVGNIWRLPLNDNNLPPAPMTNFSTHLLADFAIASDGKRIALSRSLSINNVVLIENSVAP